MPYLLNGLLVVVGDPVVTAPWDSFQAFTISTGFISGVNTIDIIVPNNQFSGNDGPTGIQINWSGTANSVPEPLSLSLAALCLAGLGFARLNRRN